MKPKDLIDICTWIPLDYPEKIKTLSQEDISDLEHTASMLVFLATYADSVAMGMGHDRAVTAANKARSKTRAAMGYSETRKIKIASPEE